MSENANIDPIQPTSAAEGGDNNDSNRNEEIPSLPLVLPPPKKSHLRCISAPIRANNKVPRPPPLSSLSSCLPPFPPRGGGTARSTSAPTESTSSNGLSSYFSTTSGWQIADPSLGTMRFTDATFSALLRNSSLERDPKAAAFDFWGEGGAPSAETFSLTINEAFDKDDVTDDAPSCPTCKKVMCISSYAKGGYQRGFKFNKCGELTSCSNGRWFCEDCFDDFCYNCYPKTANADDEKNKWECHLCHHMNGSLLRECEQCNRRRRRPIIDEGESAGGEGTGSNILSYDEFQKEKNQDKHIVDAQKKAIDESNVQKNNKKLLDDVISFKAEHFDPLHLGSFGLSSAAEAYLCRLDVTNEVGYDLTPDDHMTCRVNRGVRLPLMQGDTVTHEEEYENAIGTVDYYAYDNNIQYVNVRYDLEDGSTENKHYEEDPENPDAEPFPFKIQSLVRRRPEEIWLRNDAAASRDNRNGGKHPSQSVLSSLADTVETQGVNEGQVPPVKTEEVEEETKAAVIDDTIDEIHKCCICLENEPILFSQLCKKAEGQIPSLDKSPPSTCDDVFFCRGCLQRHCEMTVVDTRYSAGPVRCPGPKCGCRLPIELWHDFVSRPSLLQYTHAPRQLMAMRCPSCDVVRGLFPRLCMESTNRYEVYKEIIDNFLSKGSVDSREAVMGIVMAWHLFSSGKASPEETIDSIHNVCGFQSVDDLLDLMMGDSYESFDDDDNVDPLAGPAQGLLSLICDVERRAALALALLRKHPFIRLHCCSNKVCFKCKVDGHHEGQTCEERQAAEMSIEAQFCPACGVPTIRSEGCSHIVCVCGAHWTWEGESDY
mmetsp:Transcript_13162/g.19154  ORF Transcript_13162/g.19154 Transcript_13162/m.19154 type:complete len:826 (+) Transcript_13162:55-2532(+)